MENGKSLYNCLSSEKWDVYLYPSNVTLVNKIQSKERPVEVPSLIKQIYLNCPTTNILRHVHPPNLTGTMQAEYESEKKLQGLW